MISVIVPIYNSEKYLNECVESILSQTYTDIELILLNDNSSDSSLEMCKKYATLDNRVVIVNETTRQGLHRSRNKAITMATGEYICFVDSDDFIKTTMLEQLLRTLHKAEADMSMCEVEIIHRRDKNINLEPSHQIKSEELTPEQAIHEILTNTNVDVHVFNKLYKKSLFDNVSFSKSIFCEGLATTYQIIDRAEKIGLIREKLYFHCVRKKSKSNALNEDNELDFMKVCDTMTAFIDFYYPKLKEDMARKYLNTCIRTIKKLTLREFDETSEEIKSKHLKTLSEKVKELKQLFEFNENDTKVYKLSVELIIKNPERYLKYLKIKRRFFKIED